MFFIDKDQRITFWQINITSSKPQSPLLSCLPFFHHDLNCFVQWHTSLALTNRPYIHRLFLFFLPPRFALFIFLFYRIAVSSLSNSVSMWSLGQHVSRFSKMIILIVYWYFSTSVYSRGHIYLISSEILLCIFMITPVNDCQIHCVFVALIKKQ